MPAALAFAVGLMGAAALLRWCVKEVQRVNVDLDNLRGRSGTAPIDRDTLPKLKRDPDTGEYRPD
ncbi:MAG TPA: hypothetical protein VEK75_10710 [Xanthobacteraceae bacterium]|jgi:hypothetical protein|nr:hypothetical protein [Xanthobacteraceae bacterium]